VGERFWPDFSKNIYSLNFGFWNICFAKQIQKTPTIELRQAPTPRFSFVGEQETLLFWGERGR
jgi:hypothetical protein